MEYKLIERENAYDGFFKLYKYHLKHQLFNGQWSDEFVREVFERGHAAAVLLFDEKADRLVFVEQFRPGAIATEDSPWLMELVAGMIEKGESPKQVIYREAEEEANASILRHRKIFEYLVSPGGTTERIWLYIGEVDSTKVAKFAGLESENEDIKVHQISTQEAFERLDLGRFNNAMTIIALQWLRLKMNNGEEIWE